MATTCHSPPAEEESWIDSFLMRGGSQKSTKAMSVIQSPACPSQPVWTLTYTNTGPTYVTKGRLTSTSTDLMFRYGCVHLSLVDWRRNVQAGTWELFWLQTGKLLVPKGLWKSPVGS